LKTYRSRLKIVLDILKAIEEGEDRVTRILLYANLSHERLVKYLDELVEKGLIETVEGGGKIYRLTEKGYRFLRELERAEKLAEAFGFRL